MSLFFVQMEAPLRVKGRTQMLEGTVLGKWGLMARGPGRVTVSGPYLTPLSVLCTTGCTRRALGEGLAAREKLASVSCFSQGLQRKALSVATEDQNSGKIWV